MDKSFELPPLPESSYGLFFDAHQDDEYWQEFVDAEGFTADQMQAYARAAVEAEREAIANMCEDDPSLAFAGRYTIAAAIRARKEQP